MSKVVSIIATVVLIIGAGIIINRVFFSETFDLPSSSGDTETTTILIQNGEVVENADKNEDTSDTELASQVIEKEIMITDGVKHSVPLDEIRGGGPPKDGIPPINDPKFISISEAEKDLVDEEPGIFIDINGIKRFYPYQILVFHEIVNDTVGSRRILVTYCPLCFSGVVFDPVVNGERVEFGTSGKLWQSNLVMYDRSTDSLWSQILGEAIVGEMTGTALERLPSDIARFGEWKRQNPGGEVLSRDTGAIKFYGRDPYGDYYTTPGVYFPVTNTDNRLEEKDLILGVVIGGKAKAYFPDAVKVAGTVNDTFGGKNIVLEYDKGLDVVRIFEEKTDGTRERINPIPSFWFAWAAAHPDTELLK